MSKQSQELLIRRIKTLRNNFDDLSKSIGDPMTYTEWLNPYNYPHQNYEVMVQHIEDLMVQSGLKNGDKVLDAGCGTGFHSLAAVGLGAGHVHSIDVIPSSVKICRGVMDFLDIDNVSTELMDVNDMTFDDNFFDVVYSVEAISHYKYLLPFLKETKRVLKPGGILYIKDANNAQNRQIRNYTISKWHVRDSGVSNILPDKNSDSSDNTDFTKSRWKPDKTIDGSHDGFGNKYKPYNEVRKEMIADKYPNLDNEKISLLAEATRGYWGNDIYNAVDNFIKTSELPKRIDFNFCREPKDGQYCERLYYPYELKKQIEDFGFKVKVYAHCATKRPYRYLNPIFRIFSRLALNISKSLRIISVKQ